eukprot:90527-Hanusia_phi.AAC.1
MVYLSKLTESHVSLEMDQQQNLQVYHYMRMRLPQVRARVWSQREEEEVREAAGCGRLQVGLEESRQDQAGRGRDGAERREQQGVRVLEPAGREVDDRDHLVLSLRMDGVGEKSGRGEEGVTRGRQDVLLHAEVRHRPDGSESGHEGEQLEVGEGGED